MAFESQQRLIARNNSANNPMLAGLWGGTIGGLLVAILFTTPLERYQPIKTGLLTTSLGSSIGLMMVYGSRYFRANSRTSLIVHEAEQKLTKHAIAAQLVAEKKQAEMAAQMQLKIAAMEQQKVALLYIQRIQDPALQVHYLNEFGMGGLAKTIAAIASGQVDQIPAAKPPGMALPGDKLQRQAEEQEQAEKAKAMNAVEGRYRQLYRQSMTWLGKSGEGKTNACQYWLWCWIKEAQARNEPLPVLYVYDRHYGSSRNDGYEGLWLGIPGVTEVPKHVKSCVYQNIGNGGLKQWLEPIVAIYKYRMANQQDPQNKYPYIIFGIDEFTTEVNQIQDNKEKEWVKTQLASLNTGAQKFGIYFFSCIHDPTEKTTGVGRAVYGQTETAIGCHAALVSDFVKYAPSFIPPSAVETAGQAVSQFGKPAGFVVSGGIVDDDYLPVVPMNNRQMVIQWETPAPTETVDTTAELISDDELMDAWDEKLEEKVQKIDPDFDVEEAVEDLEEEEIKKSIPQTQPKPAEPDPSQVVKSSSDTRDLKPDAATAGLFTELKTWYQFNRSATDDEIFDKYSELQQKYFDGPPTPRDRMTYILKGIKPLLK